MKNNIRTDNEWFDRLLPEGIPVPSSILLSGPGGSGKPLIGNVITSAWLRQGGSVVFMSLQYPDHSFIATSLKNICDLDINQYKEHTAFIELDVSLDGMSSIVGNHFKANLVKPAVWDAALERAIGMVKGEVPGVLVFGSALNLLLFSPTYGEKILEKVKLLFSEPQRQTYIFSTSTTAKAEDILELETTAENLITTWSEKTTHKLFMKIEKMKSVSFVKEEIEVPFPTELLHEVKEIADHSRKRVIPQISKI